MRRDVAAGALLVNVIPHAIAGMAGCTFLTPLAGPKSSARTNLVWAGMNLAAGIGLLASTRWRGIGQAAAVSRIESVRHGVVAMTALGVVFEAARSRTSRSH